MKVYVCYKSDGESHHSYPLICFSTEEQAQAWCDEDQGVFLFRTFEIMEVE